VEADRTRQGGPWDLDGSGPELRVTVSPRDEAMVLGPCESNRVCEGAINAARLVANVPFRVTVDEMDLALPDSVGAGWLWWRGGREETLRPETYDELQLKLYRSIQVAVDKVLKDVLGGAFHFNTALSALMELTNELYLFADQSESFKRRDEEPVRLFRAGMRNLVLLLAPIAPHLCEEIWERMGNQRTIFVERLPEPDRDYLKADTYELVIQVNGKVRSRVDVAKDSPRDRLEEVARSDEKIRKLIDPAKVVKVVVVPGSLVNIVVKQ